MVPTKITGSHLDRVALVYVRQSSLAQVREHTESTARQYALAEQATMLGWAPGSVQVIDADLESPAGPPRDGTGSVISFHGFAWARSARCSAWRCPGWPGPLRT